MVSRVAAYLGLKHGAGKIIYLDLFWILANGTQFAPAFSLGGFVVLLLKPYGFY
ncbi:hypothetical protein BDV40DRAFT_176632 [Aspergillus tamarii]|uniref:Uncharacterized protein n=1 Tax=Aspergillus tamarii TaxID=41984 RepID=A0A5N6USR5_ASPTM|nr:hypothetical protein BDV40DRAFT_176632 [Aspergillus tamarii]